MADVVGRVQAAEQALLAVLARLAGLSDRRGREVHRKIPDRMIGSTGMLMSFIMSIACIIIEVPPPPGL
jgi:hypothetical protein